MKAQLLAHLARHANHHGLVLTREERLTEQFRTSREALAQALATLEQDGQVEILSPLPYLVLKLRSWSGDRPARTQDEQQNGSIQRDVHREVPVSSIAAAATQQREVGGLGEGEGLLDEVVTALGPEADPDEFRAILAGQDASLIHRALKRVQATKSIRVSRAALFRALLRKLSH